jgi:hypothetical protein
VSPRRASHLVSVKDAPAELVVVVGCHGLVCTLPVRHVDRLALREEVEPLRPAPGKRRESAAQQLVVAAGQVYAAWNLGTMLELPPLSVAWVLLRVPSPAGPVAIALRTGPCLMVQLAPPAVPLPPRVVRARPGAVSGAFATATLPGKRLDGLVGLTLDPERLWSEAELQASRAAIAAAASPAEVTAP